MGKRVVKPAKFIFKMGQLIDVIFDSGFAIRSLNGSDLGDRFR